MDEDGGAPEQRDTESTGVRPPADAPRRLLIVGGTIAAVCVIAAISYTVGDGGELEVAGPPDDDGPAITLPTSDPVTSLAAPATTPAPATAPPTTPPPATPPPETAPPSTAPPTTSPAGPTTAAPTASVAPAPPGTGAPGEAVTVEAIVPDIAASRRHLDTPQLVQATVDRLLRAGGRHDVALPGVVATLCATVELPGPIELSGRWERDGQVIAETGIVLRSAPGFGDCIDNDGEPLEDGSYQFIATDVDGTDSAVGNFVVGASRVDQQFVNNGTEPICAVLVAPVKSDFYEDYVFASPLPPSASVVVPIAGVTQDVEVWGCAGPDDNGDDERTTLARFDFDPVPGQPQPLIP